MAQATNPRGPLILIVDDDENVLEIATEFVQRLRRPLSRIMASPGTTWSCGAGLQCRGMSS